MKKSRASRRGFTLFELIVVIAVIGILAAVLVPTFAHVLHSARLSAAKQSADTLDRAMQIYLAQNQPSTLLDQDSVCPLKVRAALCEVTGSQLSSTPLGKEGYLLMLDTKTYKIELVHVQSGSADAQSNAQENNPAAMVKPGYLLLERGSFHPAVHAVTRFQDAQSGQETFSAFVGAAQTLDEFPLLKQFATSRVFVSQGAAGTAEVFSTQNLTAPTAQPVFAQPKGSTPYAVSADAFAPYAGGGVPVKLPNYVTLDICGGVPENLSFELRDTSCLDAQQLAELGLELAESESGATILRHSTPQPLTLSYSGSGSVKITAGSYDDFLLNGAVELDSLTNVTVKVIAPDGWRIKSISADGKAYNPTENPCYLHEFDFTITANTVITAEFVQVFEITANLQNGAKLYIDGQLFGGDKLLFDTGTEIVAKIIAPDGWRIVSVSADGQAYNPTENPCYMHEFDFTITTDTVIIAEFVQVFEVTASLQNGAKLYIDGQLFGGDKLLFDTGAEIDVKVVAPDSWRIKSISADGKAYNPTENPCYLHEFDFTITANTVITAEFVQVFEITANLQNGAKLYIDGQLFGGDELLFDTGTNIVAKIIAPEGWRIESVTANGQTYNPTENPCYEFDFNFSIISDTVITAEFVQVFEITADLQNGAKLYIDGQLFGGDELLFDTGTNIVAKIIAPEGWRIESVTANGQTYNPEENLCYMHEFDFTITTDTVINAEFVQVFEVTADLQENAELCINGEPFTGQTLLFDTDTNIVAKITAPEGWRIASATVGDEHRSYESSDCSEAIFNFTITADTEITAIFVQMFKVEFSGENASFYIEEELVESPLVAGKGESISITVRADEGYYLVGLTLNSETVELEEYVTEHTFVFDLESDCIIEVTAEVMPLPLPPAPDYVLTVTIGYEIDHQLNIFPDNYHKVELVFDPQSEQFLWRIEFFEPIYGFNNGGIYMSDANYDNVEVKPYYEDIKRRYVLIIPAELFEQDTNLNLEYIPFWNSTCPWKTS